MNKRLSAALALTAVVAASAGLSTPSTAHHAFASEFDINKPVQFQGTVTRARIVNPHGWIFIDVKGANGAVTNWGFEFGAPGTLKAKGITRDTVAAGTVVSISGYRSKNTGPFGYAQTVVLPGGREVQVGGAPDAPSARRSQ